MRSRGNAIVLFDGVCNLCNGFVTFIIARDPHARFRFASLSSPAAAGILRAAGVALPLPDTVVLVEDGKAHVRSDAALRVVRRLRFPWPVAYALAAVPRPIRDWVYDFIAARRYQWFGRRDVCMIPTAELRSRFLGS